jgi:hypothetical protein
MPLHPLEPEQPGLVIPELRVLDGQSVISAPGASRIRICPFISRQARTPSGSPLRQTVLIWSQSPSSRASLDAPTSGVRRGSGRICAIGAPAQVSSRPASPISRIVIRSRSKRPTT